MDIHSQPSMSHMRGSLGWRSGPPWEDLTPDSVTQSKSLFPEKGCIHQLNPWEDPPLSHRNIRKVAYVKVRIGTRIEECHCRFGLFKQQVAVCPPKARANGRW